MSPFRANPVRIAWKTHSLFGAWGKVPGWAISKGLIKDVDEDVDEEEDDDDDEEEEEEEEEEGARVIVLEKSFWLDAVICAWTSNPIAHSNKRFEIGLLKRRSIHFKHLRFDI